VLHKAWNKSYKCSWSDETISASEVTTTPGPLYLCLEENHQDLNTVTPKTKQDPPKPNCKLPTTERKVIQPAPCWGRKPAFTRQCQRRLHKFCPPL